MLFLAFGWILLSETCLKRHAKKKRTKVKTLRSVASIYTWVGERCAGCISIVLWSVLSKNVFSFEEKLFQRWFVPGFAFQDLIKCIPIGCFPLLVQKKKKKDFWKLIKNWHLISWAFKWSYAFKCCTNSCISSVVEVLLNRKQKNTVLRERISPLPSSSPARWTLPLHAKSPGLSDHCCTPVEFILWIGLLVAFF